MLRLYGTSRSRAARSLVLLEELGLDYEHVPLFATGRDRAADRALLDSLNPNGHIPVLADGDLVMWESMAINFYLAAKHPGPLWPTQPPALAATYQWSLWSQTEIDRADWNRARRGGVEAQIEADHEALLRSLGVLDRALRDQDYLLGDAFTVADVNVATTLSQPNELGLIGWQKVNPATAGLANLGRWLDRCAARPSYARVLALP